MEYFKMVALRAYGQPAMPPCHLSFSGRNGFDEVCAEHYHLLREFALDHEDANLILQAID